jgi:hypothetical protein
MLNMELKALSVSGRAQRLRMRLEHKNRILFIVNNFWGEFKFQDIGIHDIRENWKILITTPCERVCISMDCQKTIHLELLSKDESWNLFQKFARIDDKHSMVLNDVPRKICNACMGLPIAIKIVGSLFKGRKEIEWRQAFMKLRESEASDDEDNANSCLQLTELSYNNLPTQRAKRVFLLCSLFPEEFHFQREDLERYADGLGDRRIRSMRSSIISEAINVLLDA